MNVKFLIKKGITILAVMAMLAYSLCGVNVFAENSDMTVCASADFEDVTAVEGTHNGLTLEHKPVSGGTKDGAPVIDENPIPYYGAMLKYAQTNQGKMQRMVFTLNEPIAIGENAPENSYAEFSYDIKLEKGTTGVLFDFGGSYNLNLNSAGKLISNNTTTHATITSGTNKVFNNIRVRVDLNAKTLVGIYANDELVADLSESPLACAETTAESISKFRIYIGKGSVTDTLYLDNVNVVTYTSEDGTSPIANKAALRAELDKFIGVGLSGSAKVTVDNAVALAKNPIASQSDVDAIVVALGNINPSEFPEIVASATFDNCDATSVVGNHNGMELQHIAGGGGTKDSAPVIDENPIPYYGAMLKYTQSSPGNFQRMVFTLDNPIAIGENALENTYAEFSYDIKLEKGTTGVLFDFGGSYNLNLNSAGKLISNNTTTHAIITSGTNKVFNNIRVRVDLNAKTVVGIYANDELVADLSEAPLACAATTDESISNFRIYIAKGSVTDTLYLDNVNVITYTSEDGTSPIGDKTVLREKVDEIYSVAQSETAKNAIQNAVLCVKMPTVSQADIDSALAELIDVSKRWLKEDVFIDGIYDLKESIKIESANELKASSDINAKVYFSNPSDEDKTILCVIGYYDSCGALIDVSVSETIMMSEWARGSKNFKFTTPENVADISGVKVFVLDGLSTLTPSSDRYFIFDDRWTASGRLNDDAAYNLVTTFYGDEGTTRGFAWSAVTEHTDMAIRYAKADAEWQGESIIDKAVFVEYDGQLYYKVDIDNLEPGERYVYKIGDMQDDVWSDFYAFTTEPENLSEFSFVGVSDPQSSNWTGGFEYYKATLDEAFEYDDNASFMVNLGDMVSDGNKQSQWNDYFKATKGYTESIPHMAVMGNHETRGDAETAGKNFSLQFNNPQNGTDAFGNLIYSDVSKDYNKGVLKNKEGTVYSFDYGNAHFAVLNSGSDVSKKDTIKLLTEQAKWLRDDMNSSDKKWKIVMVHMGLYPAKTERYDSREALLSVIDECDVDLVLQGHDHMVARTYPMRGDEIVKISSPASVTKGTGTIYSILGSAGPKRYDELTEIPSYLAFLEETDTTQPTYSVFNINNEKISVITKQLNGVVVDSFEIVDSFK